MDVRHPDAESLDHRVELLEVVSDEREPPLAFHELRPEVAQLMEHQRGPLVFFKGFPALLPDGDDDPLRDRLTIQLIHTHEEGTKPRENSNARETRHALLRL